MSALVELVQAPIDAAQLLGRFTQTMAGDGAVVSFSGYARALDRDGARVDALVLESYRTVTLASMETIAANALRRFAMSRCMVVHRTGRIAPGEAIVFVGAASAHRRAAFDGADYLMDRLKTEAVFWKREESAQGSRWIEPTDRDYADVARWQDKGEGR